MTKSNPGPRGARAAVRKIRLLLADDHPALRAGLRSLLSAEADLDVAGEAASGEDAYAWYRAHRPDVVVMDLSMEGAGGMESLRRILQSDPGARVVVYSVHTAEIMLNRALSLGALGYVSKGSDTRILIQGIREVAARRGYVSPDLIDSAVRGHAARKRPLLEDLSDREFQILLLSARGQSAAQCAQALSISEKTVRNYLTQIKSKLNVADTAGLVLVAVRAGLVEP